MVGRTLAIVALVILLRLPFLHQPIQGDDVDYLYGAEHAQIDPLHPLNTRYMFSGEMVDMRGHSHGPVNPWILGILLAALGDVREVPFHLAYTLFSSSPRWRCGPWRADSASGPSAATLLFLAVPAFVVNGNSFEADLPFLAFWMASIALFVQAVDNSPHAALTGSAPAGALAGLTAYQAVLLTPILAVYLVPSGVADLVSAAWIVTLAAPAAIAVWQLWEWTHPRSASRRGAAGLHAQLFVPQDVEHAPQHGRAGGALGLDRISAAGDRRILAETSLALGSRRPWRCSPPAFYDLNPLFWLSVGCGVLVLTWLITEALHRDFLAAWAVIFFAGALLIFFAGSARYLLPIAAPVAILAARNCRTSLARRRIRFANDPVAGLGDRQLSALGRLSEIRQDAGSRRRQTSRLGRCRMGPALLPGIGRRPAAVAGSSRSSPAIPSSPARWLIPSP